MMIVATAEGERVVRGLAQGGCQRVVGHLLVAPCRVDDAVRDGGPGDLLDAGVHELLRVVRVVVDPLRGLDVGAQEPLDDVRVVRLQDEVRLRERRRPPGAARGTASMNARNMAGAES
jgi:hypothetical protein